MLEKRHKFAIVLIIVSGAILLTQIAAASSDCPTCKVVYDDEPSTANAAGNSFGMLPYLDPSTGQFLNDAQTHITTIVLELV